MKKLTNYLQFILVLSLLCSGFINCLYNDNDTVFIKSSPSNYKISPSVNVVVESPFTNSYGIYSLGEAGHNINDYLTSMELDYNQTNSSILLKAPYLTYTTESNRYYYGSVVDTSSGSTPLGPYDTWSLTYNDQPYITSSSEITIKGYHGSTFISNLSLSLSGNSACTASKYYLQNLNITVSVPNNITSIKIYFSRIYYSSSYHEVVTSEDFYKTVTYPERTQSKDVVKENVSIFGTYTTETVTFTPYSGYTYTSFYGEMISGIKKLEISSYNYQTGTASFKVTFKQTTTRKSYSFTAFAISNRSETVYDKTITTTTIDTFNLSSPTVNITHDGVYRYPSYFLNTLTCSGRGDEGDRNMVINAWSDLGDVYSSLPSSYKDSFSNGTLDDPYLIEALNRYDYVVFHKNYGLVDFASRSSSTNRYYSKKEYRPFIVEKDNTYIVVIVASLTSILSVTILTILLIKKRGC